MKNFRRGPDAELLAQRGLTVITWASRGMVTKTGMLFSCSVIFQGRILPGRMVELSLQLSTSVQPINSDSCMNQDDFLVMVLGQWRFWAISGDGDPADGFARERLALDPWRPSQQKTLGWTDLPFSQRGCVTFRASSPGSCGHCFPMLLDPVLLLS